MADVPVPPIEEPLAELERLLIAEYIRGTGHNLGDLLARNDDDARRVRADAATYAATRLTEVESRLHYLRSLRGEE